jgi:hypothetical protein
MPYTKTAWKRRLAERSDLSSQIVHLTRETKETTVADVLYNIVSAGKLIGSSTKSGFICGPTPAVCFQDAPLTAICQNVFFEQKHNEGKKDAKTRYRAVGLAFPKDYAYAKGARPVIYDKTSEAKKFLPADQQWRIVNFDLNNQESFVDWTHEREWRIPGDFEFDLNEATLLFVNEVAYKAFLKKCKTEGKNFAEQVRGVVVMDNLLY